MEEGEEKAKPIRAPKAGGRGKVKWECLSVLLRKMGTLKDRLEGTVVAHLTLRA